jgi:hypothetical protein
MAVLYKDDPAKGHAVEVEWEVWGVDDGHARSVTEDPVSGEGVVPIEVRYVSREHCSIEFDAIDTFNWLTCKSELYI